MPKQSKANKAVANACVTYNGRDYRLTKGRPAEVPEDLAARLVASGVIEEPGPADVPVTEDKKGNADD